MDKTGLYFEELLTDKTYYTKPVFIGDTITVEIDVIDKREAKKADRGIVTFSHRVINQDNTVVMDYKIKRMLRRKT
jgi:acyl dehydratase